SVGGRSDLARRRPEIYKKKIRMPINSTILNNVGASIVRKPALQVQFRTKLPIGPGISIKPHEPFQRACWKIAYAPQLTASKMRRRPLPSSLWVRKYQPRAIIAVPKPCSRPEPERTNATWSQSLYSALI